MHQGIQPLSACLRPPLRANKLLTDWPSPTGREPQRLWQHYGFYSAFNRKWILENFKTCNKCLEKKRWKWPLSFCESSNTHSNGYGPNTHMVSISNIGEDGLYVTPHTRAMTDVLYILFKSPHSSSSTTAAPVTTAGGGGSPLRITSPPSSTAGGGGASSSSSPLHQVKLFKTQLPPNLNHLTITALSLLNIWG